MKTMHALVFLDLSASPPTVSRVLLTSSRHVTINMQREAATELWSVSASTLEEARRKLVRILSEPPFTWTRPFLREDDLLFGEVRIDADRPMLRARNPFHGPGGE